MNATQEHQTYYGKAVTIAAGQTVSGDMLFDGVGRIVGLYISTWDSGTISFQTTVDKTTWRTVREDVGGTALQTYVSETLGDLNNDGSEAIHWGFNDNEIALLLHANGVRVVAENTQVVEVTIKPIIRII